MNDVRVDIKIELLKRGKRLRDLSIATGYDYSRLSKMLNGFEAVPADFDKRIYDAFRSWRAEQNPVPTTVPTEGGRP